MARTVVYVHGIGNKPPASVLKCQWDKALFGVDMGDRTRMSYWVNREYYRVPLPDSCAGADFSDSGDDDSAAEIAAAASNRGPVEAEIQRLTNNPRRRNLLNALAARIQSRFAEDRVATKFAALQLQAKILPLPESWRRAITRSLTRKLLRDVHDFLFVEERRRAMEESLLSRLRVGGGPFVVVAHSQGTMIAYNVLRRLRREDCQVPLLVTIGSPLGLDEVQDVLVTDDFVGRKTLPFPPCVDRWVNVADRLDPVCADVDLSNEKRADWRKIVNYSGFQVNLDSPQHPHSGTGYLRTTQVRSHVQAVVGSSFPQAVSSFVVARDLVARIEDARPEERRDVLIQLAQPTSGRDLLAFRGKLVARMAEVVEATLKNGKSANGEIRRSGRTTATIEDDSGDEEMVDDSSGVEDGGIRVTRPVQNAARIEQLQRFVAAMLTREEVETLRSEFGDLHIDTIWQDAGKRKLISASTHTLQVRPATLGYGATGEGIHWAVLDTGVWARHPHFKAHGNIVSQWDCTAAGPLKAQWKPGKRDRLDDDGHGTHVAGIIAGSLCLPIGGGGAKNGEEVLMEGMAPRASLHIYKVLDQNGNGRDSWIIKALDHIAEVNERAGQLVIHGVNLSLGGTFDPDVYGCGHSPLCQELRRLWGQGVLVCLAAGNEGQTVVSDGEGEDVALNTDLSIGDPANLEESIAVGSVHKTNPYTFGISYFSSRGPTADGRRKPDVVAPGERIISACHRATLNDKNASELYVEMTGTSMATPHVSGLLAAFLSARKEFIGYPDRVKEILLKNSSDLRRDPYFQGAGLPNLVKMLLNS